MGGIQTCSELFQYNTRIRVAKSFSVVSCKMSLKGLGAEMLGMDHPPERFEVAEPGADPGVFGGGGAGTAAAGSRQDQTRLSQVGDAVRTAAGSGRLGKAIAPGDHGGAPAGASRRSDQHGSRHPHAGSQAGPLPAHGAEERMSAPRRTTTSRLWKCRAVEAVENCSAVSTFDRMFARSAQSCSPHRQPCAGGWLMSLYRPLQWSKHLMWR